MGRVGRAVVVAVAAVVEVAVAAVEVVVEAAAIFATLIPLNRMGMCFIRVGILR